MYLERSRDYTDVRGCPQFSSGDTSEVNSPRPRLSRNFRQRVRVDRLNHLPRLSPRVAERLQERWMIFSFTMREKEALSSSSPHPQLSTLRAMACLIKPLQGALAMKSFELRSRQFLDILLLEILQHVAVRFARKFFFSNFTIQRNAVDWVWNLGEGGGFLIKFRTRNSMQFSLQISKI